MSLKSNSLPNRYFGFVERLGLSDYFIFHILLVVVIGSGLLALIQFNDTYLTTVPTAGGQLVEGVVGTPRFVNPVLAITRADHDVAALVYSGLMKINEQGDLVNDLAENINLSEDGRTYHITMKEGLRFHDGSSITARDVAFTIGLIQNPDLKSPLHGAWSGVIIEELSDRELNITLEEPYAPFIENFRIGILPREIWDEIPTEQLPFSQHNTEPIGSGPYRITDVTRNKSGLINAYQLKAFTEASVQPNIDQITFRFYQNEELLAEALEQGELTGTPSLTIEQLTDFDVANYTVVESPLPRTFAIYFNQNKSTALRDLSARQALEASIDRVALVEHTLHGYGVPADTPIPEGFLTLTTATTSSSTEMLRPETILVDGGWQKTEDGAWQKEIDDETVTLSFTIATVNTALFEETARLVAEAWQAEGVQVQVDQFEQTDLVQGIIRPRDFQALLFGADLGRSVDLYPFWHSSQKDDPGLNIARYTNITVDGLLDDFRVATNNEERGALASELAAVLNEELPAITLFAPTFTYVIDERVSMTPFAKLSRPSERFANIAGWHMSSSNVWSLFSE